MVDVSALSPPVVIGEIKTGLDARCCCTNHELLHVGPVV